MTYNITDKKIDILDLLLKAKEQGISIFLENGKVRLKVKEGVELTDAFLKELKEGKERIKQFLESEAGQYKEISGSYIRNEIKPYDRKTIDNIPLSFAQERLWFIDKLQGSDAYHIPGVMRIKGELDIKLLNEALKALVTRHESLRTVFRDKEGVGYQYIIESDNFEMKHISKLPENIELSSFIDSITSKSFDLSKDYMLRATIVAENDTSHILILVLHHIAADGWSLPIVISELETNYQSLRNGMEANLESLPIQYADYSIWQRSYLSGQILEDKLLYWKTKLQDSAVLELPIDYVRPTVKSTEGAMHRFKIDKETTAILNQIAKNNGATLFMTLLSVYKILLYKYTQQVDISVGTPIANREQEEVAGLIGFFINTIVLRDHLNTKDDFTTLLQQVKQTCLSAYTHQDVPFERILDHLSVERDQSRSPLFQTMFVFQNTEEVGEMSLGESAIETVSTAHTTAQFDLMFNATETSSEITIDIEYVTALFKQETIERIGKHFSQLLQSVTQNLDISIASLKIMTDEEEAKLLEEFNTTTVEYPYEETVVSLFEAQVAKTPNAVALLFEEKEVSYKELDSASNQVANYLISKGITTNSLVPICIERSLEMHIGILGILKAGGAYVPIDTNNPVERIDFIVNDINAEIILTSATLSEVFAKTEKELFYLDQLDENLSAKAVEVNITPSQLAYAIYTSGTTGLPKGVKNAHSGLLNRLLWMQEDVNISNESVLIQKTPYVFDVSVWEILMPLVSGCKLVIAKPEGHKDPIYLEETIEKHGVNLIHFVPSMLAVFIETVTAEKCKSLQNIVCSGEALPVQMVRDFKSKFTSIGIRNYYGPTEAAIDVTAIDLTDKDYEVTIPIGKPVANTSIYIVGDDMELSPIGVSGELLIGGVQVSEGYVNREELTKEKFIASPFKESERLYKTGDIARWSSDGNIEYLGRKDDQVKLRGYRIELGEITAALDQIEGIKQSLVIVREDKDSKQLVAYIVSEEEVDTKAIQAALSTQLPEYMIPKMYMQLETFPLTTNGKVNRKALPVPADADYQTTEYVAPSNEVEQQIAGVWEEQLEIERVGIHDNFFELGGDSIKIIRLISVINKQYDTNIAIASFYQSPTIENLAKLIKSENKEDQASVYLAIEQEIEATALSVRNNHPNQEEIENVYPMSDIQVGMVLTSEVMRSDGEIGIYHDQMVSQVGILDVSLMERALDLLVQKHEILRTSFHLYEYEAPIQIINKKVVIEIGVKDITENTVEERTEIVNTLLEKERTENPFDVTNAPLWRVHIFQIGTTDSIFVFQFHHAIMDGWSDKSFRSELMETYLALEKDENYQPTPLSIGMKESVVSDLIELRNEDNINYWKDKLQDYKRLDILTNERYYDQTDKVYDKELYTKILAKCKEDHIVPKSLFFAGYLYVLSLFSSEKDITIGTVSHRRPVVEDGDKLLGCFLNTVPFRFQTDTIGESSWLEYIQAVEVELHQLSGKDRYSLLEISKLHQESSDTNPFFDIIFGYLDFHVIEKLTKNEDFKGHINQMEEENVSASDFERTNTFFEFIVNVTDDQMVASLSQTRRLKSGHSLDELLIYFDNFLDNYLHHSNDLVANENIIPNQEKDQLLELFNATTIDRSESKSIVDLFENQVKLTPNNVAIVYENETLTYKQLSEKSNQLAHYLQMNGVEREDLIPICIERSLNMIIGILGILKSGGAYVPISPDYPSERINFILSDISANIIVTQSSLANNFNKGQIKQVCLDNLSEELELIPANSLDILIDSDQLMYIIYTSGTTGQPKGVMIPNKGIMNLALDQINKFQLTEKDKTLQFASVSFDAFGFELYASLLSGGSLFIVSNELINSELKMNSFIKENEITVATLPPSYLQTLIDSLSSLRIVISAGEPINIGLTKTLQSQGVTVINGYGPTESSICAAMSLSPLYTDTLGTIGKPIANTQIYILGNESELLPRGVVGELCISGFGLSRGYLNNQKLTREKFINHPFKGGERLYKTGDHGRWLPDGNLEFVGRNDHQVKIRGYRIELGEIESALDQLKNIQKSIVITSEEKTGGKHLIAYISSENDDFDTEEIQKQLLKRLPEYMVPKVYIFVNSFPLTHNGKINRKELLSYDTINTSQEDYITPTTDVEIKLVEIWLDLLEIEEVGIQNNFFELGGHSILAIQLIFKIQSEFDVTLDVNDIFATPTIAELALLISKSSLSEAISIDIKERPLHIPLSYAQERLWFIDNLEGTIGYHIPEIIRFNGALDIEVLSNALRALVDRHESLRTVIRNNQGIGYQHIINSDDFKVSYITDLAKGESVPDFIDKEVAKAFDLSQDYMLRLTVLKENPTNHILIFVFHHIISDGWSMPIFVKELDIYYKSLLKGEEVLLPALPIQYADYSIWQREYLSGKVLEEKLAYWSNKLKGAISLELPTDYKRPDIISTEGARYHFTISEELTKGLKKLSQKNEATLFMTLLSIYKVLLYKYSNQPDISVGTPIANREQAELSGLIGFFVNTIVLRDILVEDATFLSLLEQVKETCLSAYKHQDVPFERIVDDLSIERDQSRSPLFQTEFILQNNVEIEEVSLGENPLETISSEHSPSLFDLVMNAEETAMGISIVVVYATALFKKETIVQMAKHFEQLVQSVLKDANQSISTLEILTNDAKHQLLETFNSTTVVYEKEQTIVDLFEAQVERVPNANALIHENKILTYKELNEKANQFAHHLKNEYDIKPNDLVGVMMNRSEWAIISILGILKSGAAYVPIDIEFPDSRKQFIVEESSLKVLVINSDSLFDVIKFNMKIVSIDIEFDSFPNDEKSKTNLVLERSFSDLAYIIYTSGSTGNPKGVMVMHENFANMVVDHSKRFDITEKDAVSQFTSFSFDVSASEIFMSLVSGSCLVMLNKSLIEDGELFVSYLQEKNVTIAHIPPSYLISLQIEKLTFIKVLVVGGEAPNLDVVYECAKNSDVYNAYGPTECTVCSTIYKVDVNNQSYTQLPIGKPISNTQIYILDKQLQIVPTGVVGELCIAGTGLTKGYLNQPELTAEKFIVNPFKEGERLYKTGDLAKWNLDGNIEFIGRKDHQVKIRGYRIELGEIEAALEDLEGVQQSVVIVHKNKADIKELVAYVTLENDQDVANLKTMLQDRLPDYMVPRVYVKLEAFPLTTNSKIDRKALPAPEASAYQLQEYIAPTTPEEIKLVQILQELLGIQKVGIHDNFFELGGHSVLAIRLVSHIQSTFRIAFNVKDVFATPTAYELAITITEGKVSEVPPITVSERPIHIPLSFAQERLWFVDKLQGSVAYHMPEVLRIKGKLDIDILSKSVKTLVARHESLRTVIKEHEGIGYQYILNSDDFEVTFISELPENIADFIEKETIRPFDLSNDYMLRVTILKEDPNNHILVFVLHHISSDGWSIPIFVSELEAYYESLSKGEASLLAELPVQYADYSIWQRAYLSGEVLENKLSYWSDKLQGTKALELPTDYVRPAIHSTEGATYQFMIEAELNEKLNKLSKENGATLFMTLLSIYKILLYRYTGNSDISVGTPIANREQVEIAGLIGFFINTLVLRDEFESDISFLSLLEQVKQTCLDAYTHQDIPFERIVDHLEVERDQSRTPLFQTLFALQNNTEVTGLNLGESRLEMVPQEYATSKFDLSLNAVETSSGIAVSMTYATALFKEETIKRMAEHFKKLISSVLDDLDQPLETLGILSKSENELLLETFSLNKVTYVNDKNIVDLFEEQVQKTPESIALVFEDKKLTYKELDEKSNQVAHCLASKGVTKETLVPICMEPSLETIIGLLGILKSGGAYVPLDPIFPAERIAFILKDIEANILVTTRSLKLSLETINTISSIYIDELKTDSFPTSKLKTTISHTDLAYVIYTSGTTGNPKGVLIEHHSLSDYIHGICDRTNIRDCKSFALITSIATDIVNTALFPPLILGGELHILPKDIITDAHKMATLDVDCVKVVPSYWYSLQSKECSFMPNKCLLFGGEELKDEMLAFLRNNNYNGEVYNHYGPTETTIGKLLKKIDIHNTSEKITLGKPFGNTEIYILDNNNLPSPIGIIGELCIAGEGLARGYLNRLDLTEAKFITTAITEEKSVKIYKTGDLARWLPNGEIDFIGRKDHQVKIRGYRVELNEIESILDEFEEIKQSIVLVKEDAIGGKQLIGYLLLESEIDTQKIQNRLLEKLPDYMVPKTYMILESFPFTSNGKIDRKKLPAPEVNISQINAYAPPITTTEIGLVNIWQNLLNVEKIGIHDNFFELGGDSIMAIQLVSRSKSAGFNYMVKDIFSHQTIAKIARHLKSNVVAIQETGVLEGVVPLHPIQKEFFKKEYEAYNHYNQSVLLKVSKKVSKEVLERTLQELVAHHDALRFGYKNSDNEALPIQEYTKELPSLITTKIESLDVINDLCEKYQASLDILNGELVRAVFIETPETVLENRFFITIHHLGVDGVSWRILLEDLTNVLESFQNGKTINLPEKETSYRQWTEKLTEYATSETLASEYPYWENVVSNYTNVPVDHEYDKRINFQETKEYSVRLNVEDTKSLLQDVNKAYKTEINDILLSALALACKDWITAKNVVIALEGHGREELFEGIDINRTVGWFTTIYPVSLAIPNGEDFKTIINTTKNTIRNIPNKGIGFGVLRHLSPSEDVQATLSSFKKEIVFNYLGNFENSFSTEDNTEKLIGFAGESKGTDIGISNTHTNKLVINSLIENGCLQLNWSYDSKRYKATTVEKIANAYITSLEKIISHCNKLTHQEEDKHLLLFQSKGNNAPIFMIPPLGGTSFVLESFAAEFGENNPIYGIEMEGIFEGEDVLTSMEEIAAKNIDRIKKVQENGPYILVGYSFGGSVVYEMSKQLEKEGEEVIGVLLDQAAYMNEDEAMSEAEVKTTAIAGISDAIKNTGQEHKLNKGWEALLANRLDTKDANKSWMTIMEYMQANNIELPSNINSMGRIFKLFIANISIEHTVKETIKNMILVKSEREVSEDSDYLRWDHFNQEVELIHAKGNHHTMIRDENGKELAQKIKITLNKLLKK